MAISALGSLTGITDTTSRTSWVVTYGNACNAGELVLIALATDNSRTFGTGPVTSLSDNAGNSYPLLVTQSLNWGIYDSPTSAANDGCSLFIFGKIITNAITVSTTHTFAMDTATVAKATTGAHFSGVGARSDNATFWDSHSNVGDPIAFTTSSVTNGGLVFCAAAVEALSATPTGDSDTTNGSWSSIVAANTGTTTSSVGTFFQYKIVTATATQTWNISQGVKESSWAAVAYDASANQPHTHGGSVGASLPTSGPVSYGSVT